MDNSGLTGSIPNCVCDLSFLKYLYLSDNFLTGELPTCLNNLTFLREIHVSCNNLDGSIPESYNDFADIVEFHAQCNPDLSCVSDFQTKTLNSINQSFIFLCGNLSCSDTCLNLIPVNIPTVVTETEAEEVLFESEIMNQNEIEITPLNEAEEETITEVNLIPEVEEITQSELLQKEEIETEEKVEKHKHRF